MKKTLFKAAQKFFKFDKCVQVQRDATIIMLVYGETRKGCKVKFEQLYGHALKAKKNNKK